ncbi:hypothetical protein OSL25_24355, partial [Escherichia coli]
KTSIFSHPVYLFLRKFSLQDSRGGSPLISYPHPDVHGWCNMFEKIGVYGVVLTAHVVLNGAKKTYTLKMWVIILKESHI